MTLFLTSESTDPFENLAIERVLFESIGGSIPAGTMETLTGGGMRATASPPPTHALFVYRNSPCVVIGRHQNPWTECDLEAMTRDGVPLVRRISGGGAVYHDPGNLNFCFLGDHENYDLDRHFAVVTDALASLGIRAHRNERNDILLDGPVEAAKPPQFDDDPGAPAPRAGAPPLPAKISGNAFRHTKDVSMHHGTLLVHADLSRLTSYLAGPGLDERDTRGSPAAARHRSIPLIRSSKGIPSVRSGVANLVDVRPRLTMEALIQAIGEAYARWNGEATASAAEAPGHTRPAQNDLRTWEWRYGKTPRFQVEIPVMLPGSDTAAAFILTIYHGRVTEVSTEPENVLEPAFRESVSRMLEGIRYSADDLGNASGSGQLMEIVRLIADAAPPAP